MARTLDRLVGVPLLPLARLLPKGRRDARPLSRILVIKLAAMGDTILLVPAIRAIRKAHPQARIDWLVSPINAAIAETVPYADKVIVEQGRPGLHLIRLFGRIRRERYDAVIDFEQWARGTALMAVFSGAPVRIGFDTPGEHRFSAFTDGIKKDFSRHERDDFMALAACLAPGQADASLELWETEKGRAEAAVRLPARSARKRVLIHAGCGSDGLPREWPLPSYAVLGQWLIKNHNAELYLTGGPEERLKTAHLYRLLNGHATDLGGRLSWQAMISTVKQMDLIISGNTGVMHMAAALGRPQIALHGPTDPRIWGPLNPRARVIQTSCPQCPSLRLGFEYHRRDASCMARISVDEVKAAVSGLIDNPAPF